MAIIPAEQLVAFSKNLLLKVQKHILSAVTHSPETALTRIPDPKKTPTNSPLRVDYFAEDFCRVTLQTKFGDKILAIGEESLGSGESYDLTHHKSVVALMDIIDGTDLLVRGLSNWCSAIVFFYPPEQKIIASVVADHAGNLFFASESSDGCSFFQARKSKSPIPLRSDSKSSSLEQAVINFMMKKPAGPSKIERFSESSICFYGQKPPNFISVQTRNFQGAMEKLAGQIRSRELPTPALRLYNLGGIPMMLKVANGTVDAVFDLTGPKPHDVVAGAYIALKAGAFLGDTKGYPITETDLAQSLLKPNKSGPAYILAGTEQVYRELQAVLASNHGIIKPAVTIDEAGRVVLSKTLLDELHLAPGDTLDLTVEGERVTLCPRRTVSPLQEERSV